jgi:hypothetical protein
MSAGSDPDVVTQPGCCCAGCLPGTAGSLRWLGSPRHRRRIGGHAGRPELGQQRLDDGRVNVGGRRPGSVGQPVALAARWQPQLEPEP